MDRAIPSLDTPTHGAVQLWTALGLGSAVWQQHDARWVPWGSRAVGCTALDFNDSQA